MDQTNQYTLPTLNQFPRKAIPILLSLTLFSLLISFSSYFPSSTYLPFLLSTFSIKVLFRYSTDRTYIFLLCNGILVFLITKSGLIAKSPSANTVFTENHISEFRRSECELSERSKPVIEEIAMDVEEEEEEEEEEKEEEEKKETGIFFIANEKYEEQENEFDEEEEKKETGIFFIANEKYEEQENKFDDSEEEEEEEEDEGGRIGFLSLEELNMKCDDFIKMMKGGIKIQVQQLVRV